MNNGAGSPNSSICWTNGSPAPIRAGKTSNGFSGGKENAAPPVAQRARERRRDSKRAFRLALVLVLVLASNIFEDGDEEQVLTGASGPYPRENKPVESRPVRGYCQ